MKVKSAILNILLILVFGGIGGVLMNRTLIPYLQAHLFFLKEPQPHTTIINKVEKTIIEENTALENSIAKVENSAIGVECKTEKKVFHQGTGIILTSDGLILSSKELVPPYCNIFLRVNDKIFPAELLNSDSETQLALIKINQSNLSTISLGRFNELRRGQRVFLIGLSSGTEKFINEAIIRTINEKEINLNIKEVPFGMGSPLFNIKGELIGINLVDRAGNIKVVPINIIREFIKL